MSYPKWPVMIGCVFLWIGFVCAISFMEAWLKFRAPGITVPLGLGIGRLVFQALNKVEWFFAILILGNMLLSKTAFFSRNNLFYLIPLTLLLLQSVWLLPALDARAELHIQGLPVPDSFLHVYYVGMEMVKVIGLMIIGISLFTEMTQGNRKQSNGIVHESNN